MYLQGAIYIFRHLRFMFCGQMGCLIVKFTKYQICYNISTIFSKSFIEISLAWTKLQPQRWSMVKSKNYTGSNSFAITKTTLSKSLFQPKIFDSCILLNFANSKKKSFSTGPAEGTNFWTSITNGLIQRQRSLIRQRPYQIVCKSFDLTFDYLWHHSWGYAWLTSKIILENIG